MSARLLARFAMVLCASICVPRIAAAESARLGLTPVGQSEAYFEMTLEEGAAQTAEVEAANFGTDAADARTYAADVYSLVNGGFGAELYGESPGAVTRWITYPAQNLRLEPRDAVRVPFTISVPVGTPPGEYVAALVIESTEPMRSTGPLALNQVNRSAIAVAVTVPGPKQPTFAIGAVTHRAVAGHSILAFEVSNSGNVHMRPAGSFSLQRRDGSVVEASAVSMDSVYAGTATRLETVLREPLEHGDYCVELSLTDAASGAHDETRCLTFSVAGVVDPIGAAENAVDPLPEMLPGTSVPLRTASGLLVIGGTLTTVAVVLVATRRRRAFRAAATGRGTHP